MDIYIATVINTAIRNLPLKETAQVTGTLSYRDFDPAILPLLLSIVYNILSIVHTMP